MNLISIKEAVVQFFQGYQIGNKKLLQITWPKMTVNSHGDKEWRNEKGQWHREDGPAIEWPNGGKSWFINGKLHREGGPASEYANGDKSWYLNGLCHREDGPATELASGSKYWYLNGKFHREDGPAMECENGDKYWYLNDQLHREGGPAIEYATGTKSWYLNGQCHREDGPALECADGRKYWYLNDKELPEADFLKITKQEKKFIHSFTIDRKIWYRGQSYSCSKLLRNGKRDCLGFYCASLGVPDEEMLNVAQPNGLSPKILQQFNLLHSWLFSSDPSFNTFPSEDNLRLIRYNDQIANVRSSFDDKTIMTEEYREQKIKEIFEKNGISVCFID